MFKKFVIATTLVAAPLAASALSVTPGGGPYDLDNAPFEFNREFAGVAGPGALSFVFENTSDTLAKFALTRATINQASDGAGGFEDYYFKPIAGESYAVKATFGSQVNFTDSGDLDRFSLLERVAPGESIVLSFLYGDPVSAGAGENLVGPQLDFRVLASPVPLPAAGWMLLGALGGLGILSRRRRQA